MSFLFTGIDHVQLAAPEGCERVARSFYVDLGFKATLSPPEKLILRFRCRT